MRIAARMLPSSSLEPMAASVFSSWLRCRLAPVGESSFASTISEPLVHPSTLALITVVILRRLPALGGWPRIAGAKFSRALQLSMDLGFPHMSLRTEARALAQAGRAPLQMCFSSGPRYGGCASSSPFTTFDTPLGATWELPRWVRPSSPPISLVWIIVPPPCSSEGRLEPTHRVALGPWRWSSPPEWSFPVSRQWLHVPFGLGCFGWLTAWDMIKPTPSAPPQSPRGGSDVEQTEENNTQQTAEGHTCAMFKLRVCINIWAQCLYIVYIHSPIMRV